MRRRTYILLYLILFLMIFLTDNQIRALIAHLKNPIGELVFGSFTHIGKGHYQMLLSGILLLFGLYFRRERLRELGKMGFATVAFAGLCVQILKHLIGRARPDLWDTGVIHFGPSLKTGFDSLPSQHTTTSFALAVVLSSFYPRGRVFFYFIATIVGLSRVYLNFHFPSDVFAGAILGFLIGKTVPDIFNRFLQAPAGLRIKRIMKEHWPVIFIVFLALFFFFHKLGKVSLFDVDEAVFAEATREMMETGDWLTPQYNYTNRYDKPILFYWLMAIAYKAFGVGELQARFMSALFGTILVLTLFYFTKKVGGRTWQVHTMADKKHYPYIGTATLPLCLCMVYSYLHIFSLSRTKLPNYILPLFPALAIMAGRYWEEFLMARENKRGMTYSAGLFILCTLLLSTGFFLLPSILLRSMPDLNPLSIGAGPYIIGMLLLSCTVLFSLSLLFNKRTLSLGIIIAMMLLFTYFLIDGILPIADGYLQAPLKEISTRAGRELGKEDYLIVYGLNRPSILFYARRPAKIIRKGEEGQLKEVRGRAYIITNKSLLSDIKDYGTAIVEENGSHLLLTIGNR